MLASIIFIMFNIVVEHVSMLTFAKTQTAVADEESLLVFSLKPHCGTNLNFKLERVTH